MGTVLIHFDVVDTIRSCSSRFKLGGKNAGWRWIQLKKVFVESKLRVKEIWRKREKFISPRSHVVVWREHGDVYAHINININRGLFLEVCISNSARVTNLVTHLLAHPGRQATETFLKEQRDENVTDDRPQSDSSLVSPSRDILLQSLCLPSSPSWPSLSFTHFLKRSNLMLFCCVICMIMTVIGWLKKKNWRTELGIGNHFPMEYSSSPGEYSSNGRLPFLKTVFFNILSRKTNRKKFCVWVF